MVFSYYPGCTLKTKAKQLDRYARLSAQALGITLAELPDWQCCGGTYPMAKDEIATKLSSVRALASAWEMGQDLVTLLSLIHIFAGRNAAAFADSRIVLGNPEFCGGETGILRWMRSTCRAF